MAVGHRLAFIHGISVAALLGVSAVGTSAQAANTPTAAGSSTTLGEVVVTAQKRAENLQRAPLAVTAVTGANLEQANINQPVKLQYAVPSLTFGENSGFAYLSIRGVGTDLSVLGESTVATYQDGVYTGQIISESVPTYDLQRVEVLRGPQGTLYGRNTTGGVINYITKLPSFEPGAYASVSYGNYNALQTNVGATGPIVQDKIAARVSFHYGSHDGYFDNIATHTQDYADRSIGGRIAVLLQPTDTLQIVLRGDMATDRNTNVFGLLSLTALDGLSDDAHPEGLFSEPAAYFTSHPGLLSPSDIAKLQGGSIASYYDLVEPGVAAPNFAATRKLANSTRSPLFETDSDGASLTIDWNPGPADLKSITAYRYARLYFNHDSGGQSFTQVDFAPLIQSNEQISQEFDLSGKAFGGRLDWLAGAFFLHDKGYLATTVWLPTLGDYYTASVYLANPPGSAYAFGLNFPQGGLPSLGEFPGIPASNLQTVTLDGPDFGGGLLKAEQSVPNTPFLGFLQRQDSQSIAGFVQGTYHVTDALRLTGGIRYTADRKSAYRELHSNFIYDLTAIALSGAPASVIEQFSGLCNVSTSKRWSAPTGVVGVDYDAAPHVLTYAKAAWGYKAGGINPGECGGTYDPEYLTDYEGGLKSVWADGQILTNLAVYYYDYTNIQFTTYTNTGSAVRNAGSAKALGVELEYAVQPHTIRGLSLDGSASFEDSHYGPGCFADNANLNNAGYLKTPIQSCPGAVDPVTGLGVAAGAPGSFLIGSSAAIKGNALIRAPRWKLNVGLQYDAPLGGEGGDVLARFDAAWTDRYYNDILNGKEPVYALDTQPAYWMLNARLVWTSADKRYTAELFGENLTDTVYATSRIAAHNPPTSAQVFGSLGAPRTFGVRVSVRLGSAVH